MRIVHSAHQLAFNDWLFTALTEFVSKYASYNKNEFKKSLRTHYLFKTMDYGIDLQGVTYFTRWNINNDEVNILDLYIREDCRNKKFITKIFNKNLIFWPGVKKLKFKREKKYPFRPEKRYLLKKFVKGDNNGR